MSDLDIRHICFGYTFSLRFARGQALKMSSKVYHKAIHRIKFNKILKIY